MKPRTVLLIAVGVLLFVSASSITVFFAYRTFSTTGQRAVARMNTEELTALKLLSSINRGMSTDQVYRTLGPPSADFYLLAKWNGFGGSALSQARVYFVDEHPIKIRWIKLGFFVYETRL
jgi:hypothetical protein